MADDKEFTFGWRAAAKLVLSRVAEVIRVARMETQTLVADQRFTHRLNAMSRAVWKVLQEPEFAHAAEAHAARPYVIAVLDEHEDDIFTDHERLWNRMVAKLACSTAGTVLVSLFLISFVKSLVKNAHLAADARQGLSGVTVSAVEWLWEQEDHASQIPAALPALGVLLLCVQGVRGLHRSIRRDYEQAEAALLQSIRPWARFAINERANLEDPPLLRLEEAPSLSSVADARYRVARPAQDRIFSLIRELGASAIAISGPRGAGKSTLLRSISARTGPPFDLVVAVEAPASYSARDFTIMLYKAFCEAVVAEAGQVRREAARKAVNVARIVLRWAIFVTVVALLAGAGDGGARTLVQPYLPLTDLADPAKVAAWSVGLACVWIALGWLRLDVELHGAFGMRARAIESLHTLRYLQNVSSESSGTMKIKGVFDLGRKSTRQLIEQATSLPDLVHGYRRFAADAAAWWGELTKHVGGNVVITIDELDRINDSESAERFINEIKGIFGVDGCTYLITVSEDALALFERRMVGIRPALDSTFDEVLRLEILEFCDSVEMLGRRLVGFPHAFAGLCHALSGGIPRELVRTARALIDAKRVTGSDRLPELTRQVVAVEIKRLKSGFIPRVSAEMEAGSSDTMLALLADHAWPAIDSWQVYEAASTTLTSCVDEDGRSSKTARQLSVSLLYYATVLGTFGAPEHDFRHLDYERAAESLATARSVMPTSAELARVRLTDLRDSLGLPNG